MIHSKLLVLRCLVVIRITEAASYVLSTRTQPAKGLQVGQVGLPPWRTNASPAGFAESLAATPWPRFHHGRAKIEPQTARDLSGSPLKDMWTTTVWQIVTGSRNHQPLDDLFGQKTGWQPG